MINIPDANGGMAAHYSHPSALSVTPSCSRSSNSYSTLTPEPLRRFSKIHRVKIDNVLWQDY
jgi:hypothetical protein